MSHSSPRPRLFVKVAILTVSDTRSLATDSSGTFLQEALEQEGHQLVHRALVIDDIYQMRAVVSAWIADPEVEVILTTGGTVLTTGVPVLTTGTHHQYPYSPLVVPILTNGGSRTHPPVVPVFTNRW